MCPFILPELGMEVGERPPSPGLPRWNRTVRGMGKAPGGSLLEPLLGQVCRGALLTAGRLRT